jgi:putative nucleotidyltransferase with HDIG domain
MPAQADELLRLARSGDAAPRQVLQIVERDPALAAMVLRLVNSAAFGLAHEVTDLQLAVVLLGLGQLRALAMAASMAALFAPTEASEDAWQHAFATACAARALAEELHPAIADTAFTAGMLHDIGRLVIAGPVAADIPAVTALAELRSDALLTAEHELLGADHSQIGAALAERWDLPQDLITAVADHHVLPAAGQRTPAVASLVYVAEALCATFLNPADADAADVLVLLDGLGAARPDAMALRIRQTVAALVSAPVLVRS